MRATPFVLLATICLLVVLEVKQKMKDQNPVKPREEMQQEEEVFTGEHPYGQIRIIYEAQRPEDEAIADILWLRKAAQMVKGSGSTYFNVINQAIVKNNYLRVEGVIEISSDPMTADYDAHEILSLVISQDSL